MNAHSVLAYLLPPGLNRAQVAAGVREVEKAIRLVYQERRRMSSHRIVDNRWPLMGGDGANAIQT
jgi:hypothetical protein